MVRGQKGEPGAGDSHLDRVLKAFNGTVAVVLHPIDEYQGRSRELGAVFAVMDGLTVSTLDSSKDARPADILRIEREANALLGRTAPITWFGMLQNEIIALRSIRATFLLVTKYYKSAPAANRWLLDKTFETAARRAEGEPLVGEGASSTHLDTYGGIRAGLPFATGTRGATRHAEQDICKKEQEGITPTKNPLSSNASRKGVIRFRQERE